MKTRNIIIAGIALGCMTGFSGCEDFLEKSPQGQLTQEAFPVTASDAALATNAVYNTLRQWHYHSGGYPILDILSDDSHKGSSPKDQLSTVGPYDYFKHTTTQDGLDRWWSTLYEGIKRANVVIEKVPDIPMDEELKTLYIAEARLLRAVYYFDLVRAWGGVPKVTTITPPLQLARSTADEIYTLILEDVDYAINNLPLRSQYEKADAGRVSKGTAQALLARISLFRNDFATAEQSALDVIISGEYALESMFADANSLAGEHGRESIFEVGALQYESTEAGGDQYANTQGVRGVPNRGWGFNCPSEDLRNSFEAGDPRLGATIIDLGEVLDGVKIMGNGETPDVTTDEFGNIVERECYNQKVWIPGNNTITQWGHNRRLIRYADVLLMAAEALNENNKPGDALVYLNQVRERAREGNSAILPDITETNKDKLRDIILNERRHEFALEGLRYWDLIRTGKAVEILGPLGFVAGKHELFPIPQTEIDISQGTLQQNPNWN
ncbi:MAG: RagB/SusD family nutrient uptake outer membrane protein [Bacteroidota bacterium]